MAVLAKGAVMDRPWGQTLGALSRRGLSGQLTVTSDGKPYRVAFARGAVVGATSPLASDAAVRLALTGGLVSSTQVADITRRVAASPHRDEIEVIAEAVRLAPDQAQKLRRRLVAQRAARTFSLDRGDFVIEDEITVPVIPGSELDVRAVIHLGARNNLAEARLAQELSLFGAWFKLQPDAIADLPQYGFTETDKPVLQELIAGANLADIEGDHPEVGDRGVRAIVYALASYGACEVAAKPVPSNRPRKTSAPPISQARTVTNPNGPRRPATATPASGEPINARATGSSSKIETPEGMSLRSPRSSPQPDSRTQTPATGNTVVPRTATPTASQAYEGPRTATPTNHPAFDRPGSGTSAPAFDRARSATVPPRTQPPAVARTQTPAGEPALSRAPTTPFAGRTPTDPSTGRTPTDPNAGRTPTNPPTRPSSPTPQHPALSRAPSPQDPAIGRAPTPTGPVTSRTMTPLRPLPANGPTISRTTSQSRAAAPAGPPTRPSSPSLQAPARAKRSSAMPLRSRTNTAATLETEALIRDRLALVDRGADHFVLLGISQDATADLIRAAYFTLARKLHPDRIASLGIVDSARDAQRLFAQINTAFGILNDNLKRTEYLSIIARGGESAVRAEEAKADEIAMRVMHAEEAFRRGEMALRREQIDQAIAEFTTAVELQPQEPEYVALFTWAKFAAATDKQAVAHKTRIELQRAAERSTQSPTARFYLGRVERILGREREALEHFYEVLRIKPNHAEASSEIRVLETRLKKR